MELEIAVYILIGIVVAILIVCLTIASYSGSHMWETFERYNNYLSSSFTLAGDFCCNVSVRYLNSGVRVGMREGKLTDAYMPSKKTVFLSEIVVKNSSVSALAVAAHEMGHALQDYQNPKTLKKLQKRSITCKLLGYLMYPLIIAGIILFFIEGMLIFSVACIAGAILIFVFALSVKLSTIKIEKDASKKAIMFLQEMEVLDGREIEYAKKVLNSALLTYIGDFFQALLGWTGLTRKTKLFGR